MPCWGVGGRAQPQIYISQAAPPILFRLLCLVELEKCTSVASKLRKLSLYPKPTAFFYSCHIHSCQPGAGGLEGGAHARLLEAGTPVAMSLQESRLEPLLVASWRRQCSGLAQGCKCSQGPHQKSVENWDPGASLASDPGAGDPRCMTYTRKCHFLKERAFT